MRQKQSFVVNSTSDATSTRVNVRVAVNAAQKTLSTGRKSQKGTEHKQKQKRTGSETESARLQISTGNIEFHICLKTI